MKHIILAVLLTSITVQAKPLCSVKTDTGKQAFMFVDNLPVKTIPRRSVANIPACDPDPKLVETAPMLAFDTCMKVVFTYINKDTKVQETQYYINGATSLDGITWDREQNPGCPALP